MINNDNYYETRVKVNKCITSNDISNLLKCVNDTNYKWLGHELGKAVEAGHKDIVEYLLSNGFNSSKYFQKNILDIAIINNDIGVANILLQNKFKPTLNRIISLIENRNLDMIMLLTPYLKYNRSNIYYITKTHAEKNNSYEIYDYLTTQWYSSKQITSPKIKKNSSRESPIRIPKRLPIRLPNRSFRESIIDPINDLSRSSLRLHVLKRSYPNRDVIIYLIGKDGLLVKTDLRLNTNVPYDWLPIKTHYGFYWFKLKNILNYELSFEENKYMKDYIHVEVNNPYGYDIKLDNDFFNVEEDIIIEKRFPIRGPDLSVFIKNFEILKIKGLYTFSNSLKKNVQKIVIAGLGQCLNGNSDSFLSDVTRLLKSLYTDKTSLKEVRLEGCEDKCLSLEECLRLEEYNNMSIKDIVSAILQYK